MGVILAILLLALFLASLPTWPYSRNWGYTASGALGALLAILLILVFLTYIPLMEWPG